MALLSLLDPVRLLSGLLVAILGLGIYRVYFHPLAHIPGPLQSKLSSLWIWTRSYHGTEASEIERLHKRYGPVVRIGPNAVDISDGAAINPIYIKGNYLKDPCYLNFDIDGFNTLFSALNPAHRATRSKSVVGMFSQSNIREGKDLIQGCVQLMVDKLKMERDQSSGRPVNVLNLTRSLAIDAVSSYLFHKSWGGVMETKLSASQFVDTFVAVGRFFLLPLWMFTRLEHWSTMLAQNKAEIDHSMKSVDDFVVQIVDEALASDISNEQTYQARLLKAGISPEETRAQLKDLLFAGTDSTGMNLATMLWYLAQQPETYSKLRHEVMADPDADPQTLPYLSGVIKEGLRLSMANPTRLPRLVPNSGLYVAGLPPIPAGTSVGCSAYSLHFNEKVFPDAHAFKPERWLKPSEEMLRDFFAWGAGARQCIARNLATAELFWAVQAIVLEDVLNGAQIVQKEIRILEWFNSKVIDEKIELVWPAL